MDARQPSNLTELTILLRVVEIVGESLNNPNRGKVSTDALDGVSSEQILNVINNLNIGTNINSMEFGDKMVNEQSSSGDHYTVEGGAGAVGREAQAKKFTIKSGNSDPSSRGSEAEFDLLRKELSSLREAMIRASMSSDSADAEHDQAIAEVGKAEIAAVEGDEEAINRHLARAGKWSLSVATATGVAVAAAAIKSALGI